MYKWQEEALAILFKDRAHLLGGGYQNAEDKRVIALGESLQSGVLAEVRELEQDSFNNLLKALRRAYEG